MNQLTHAQLSKALALASRAAVLPHDGVVDRVATAAVPQNNCLSLISDTQRYEIAHLRARIVQCAVDHVAHTSPNHHGVMFHPSRRREDLRELGARSAQQAALGVDDYCFSLSRTLVDAQNVAFRCRHPRTRLMMSRSFTLEPVRKIARR